MARRAPKHRKPGSAWRAGLRAALVVPGFLAASLGVSAATPIAGHAHPAAFSVTGTSLSGKLTGGHRPAPPDDFSVPADGGSPPLGGVTLGSTGLWPFTLLPAPGMILSAGPTLPPLGSGNPYAVFPAFGEPGRSSALAALFGQSVPGGALSGTGSRGIPVRAYQAYVAAAAKIAQTDPSCRLNWTVLAGIGRVESDHGRHAGSKIYGDGRVYPPIVGIRLDGSRSAVISDSDGGRYDGDTSYDRAVGPMQFIPGTWERYGQDADGNGVRDPQDIDDAALAAATLLCAGPIDMSDPGSRRTAVFRYNHSESYVTTVLAIADGYAAGSAVTIPSAAGLPPVVNPTPPPATVTPPAAPPSKTTPPTARPTQPTTKPTTTRPTVTTTPTRSTTSTGPTSTTTTTTTRPTTTTTRPTTTTTRPTTTTTRPTTTTTLPTTTTTLPTTTTTLPTTTTTLPTTTTTLPTTATGTPGPSPVSAPGGR